MKKKIKMLIILMLLYISTVLVVNNDVDVKATAGGDDGTIGKSIGLDLDFMWNITYNLSRVVHDVYEEGEIRKGRDFGTEGDNWTAEYIYKQMKYNLTKLENVDKIPIQMDTGKPFWYYNYKIDVIDFNLTINGEGYPFPHTVPKNESYPMVTGCGNTIPYSPGFGKMDYNHTFNDLSIVPKNLSSDILEFDTSYFNVSCDSVKEITITIGNATYIPNSESIPEDQEFRIFVLEEEDGVLDQLDNITNNASTVILIYNCGSKYKADTSNYNFSIGRAYNNDSNLTSVVEMLQNGTLMIADNFLNGNETFTFSYDFTYEDWPWGFG